MKNLPFGASTPSAFSSSDSESGESTAETYDEKDEDVEEVSRFQMILSLTFNIGIICRSPNIQLKITMS